MKVDASGGGAPCAVNASCTPPIVDIHARSRLDMCASRRRAQRSSRFGFSAKCRVYTYTYAHGEKVWMTRPRQFVLLYCVCACLFSFWAQRALLFVKEGIHHPTSPEKNREAMLGAGGGVPVVPMIIFTTVTVARTVLRFQQQSSPHIQKSAFPKTNSLSFSLSLGQAVNHIITVRRHRPTHIALLSDQTHIPSFHRCHSNLRYI